MHRRAFLAALTAIGAGCVGGGDSKKSSPASTQTATRTTTPTSTSTQTATTTPTSTPYRPEQAADHLVAARSDLKTALREFRAEESRISYTFSSPPRFDPVPTETAMQNARNELRDAEEVATPQQQSTVSALRSYADFLGKLVTTMDTYVQSLDHRYRALIQESNNRYEVAVDHLEQAKSSLDTARTHIGDAQEILTTLRSDLQNPDSVSFADAESTLNRVSDLLDGLSTVYDGDLEIERGLIEYNKGVEDYNDGYYDIAASSFSSAESDFLGAENIYTEGESGAPTELLDLILRRQCQSDNYATAASEMRKASNFADSDPGKSREHVRAAQSALNQVC